MTSSTGTRRLTAKGRATRDRIVAAAAQLMYERGVTGTSTEDILKAARVASPSQLYHYFGDKRGLVQAVIEHQTEQILGFQKPLLSRLDSIEALEAWRDAVVEAQHARDCQGGCPLGSLASELSDLDPQARARLVAGYEQWGNAIREGLRSMRERGELDGGADPDRLALALLTALQGGLLMTQTRRDTIALEAVLNTMIDHIRFRTTP
ncbi:transcriptional regulator [Streptomyces anthocyanicus]|uniref:TetR/AcrR family transcriptional regulator n=1 Tax=Streptomyces anthocyanicus TaxID=68174 RepID=UPI00166F99A2|nr:TetR/AcrR family transcriptional regulator [Streptomyces anthocyanicus]GGL79173.1 transcriptional regulator [Streptomyces anthocyanicus]